MGEAFIPREVAEAGIDVSSLKNFRNMFGNESKLGISQEIQPLTETDGLDVLEMLFPNLPEKVRPLAAEVLREIPQATLPLLYAELNKRAAVENWHAFGKAVLIGAAKVLDDLSTKVIHSYDQAEEQADTSLSSLQEIRHYVLERITAYYEAEETRLIEEKTQLEGEIGIVERSHARGPMMEEVKEDSASGYEDQFGSVEHELEEVQNVLFSLLKVRRSFEDVQEVMIYSAEDRMPTRQDPSRAIPIVL